MASNCVPFTAVWSLGAMLATEMAGFHPRILVWGGRGVAILRTMFFPPLLRVFFGWQRYLHGELANKHTQPPFSFSLSLFFPPFLLSFSGGGGGGGSWVLWRGSFPPPPPPSDWMTPWMVSDHDNAMQGLGSAL